VRTACDRRVPVREQHAAFAILVERFEAMAFATALQASDDMETARDACQEAFLLAWRVLPELREPAAFGGWLRRLIRTQCARARRRRAASDEAAHACDRSAIASRASDPGEWTSRHETLRSILRAVSELPPEEREAITLFYFLGEPLKVVAKVLGLSVGSAGKRIYTARLRLRRRLPRSIAERFLVVAPTRAFARSVQAGVFDEFMGEYQFASVATSHGDHSARRRRAGELCRRTTKCAGITQSGDAGGDGVRR